MARIIQDHDDLKPTQGYIDGLHCLNPGSGKWIVRCNKESRIFAVLPNLKKYTCPTCGRTYSLEEDGKYRSDRELTILTPPPKVNYGQINLPQ